MRAPGWEQIEADTFTDDDVPQSVRQLVRLVASGNLAVSLSPQGKAEIAAFAERFPSTYARPEGEWR